MSQKAVICNIDHPLHRGHKLRLQRREDPFYCDGCKELGFYSCYSCEVATCTFHLHRHCGKPQRSLKHPLFKSCRFRLVTHGLQRKGEPREQDCDACGESAEGSFYHCYDCGNDLHPTCANLPRVLVDGDLRLELKKELLFECEACGWDGKNHGKSSWCYVSTCKTVALHISCVKDLFLDSWLNKEDSSQGGSAVEDGGSESVKRTPMLKLPVGEKKRRPGRKLAAMKAAAQAAVPVIVAALLGDPFSIVVGISATLLSS